MTNATYMIYQTVLSDERIDQINADPECDLANAYFSVTSMFSESAAYQQVTDAFNMGLYKPTAIAQVSNSITSKDLEGIFAELNDHPDGSVTTLLRIDKAPYMRVGEYMRVGDLVVDLKNNTVHVCMPRGWGELPELALKLTAKP